MDKYYIKKIGGGKVLKHSYSISLIRLIALLMIITCHILQHEKCVLAWWFNTGVQIFFSISGFLYGKKNTGEISIYYKIRFKKILVPYYITFLFASFLEFSFTRNSFSFVGFFGGILCRTSIAGGAHLWFVSVILFCYVLTPILQSFRDHIAIKRDYLIYIVIAVLVVSIFGGVFSPFYNPAWLSCYVIGYVLGISEDKKIVSKSLFLVLFGILAVMGNSVQIYCDYIRRFTFSGYINTAYKYFCDYNHVWLGILLFLLMKSIFDKIDFSKHSRIIRLLNITDKYSYETYLVHQFLILGPFSLMALTPILSLNIVIILIGIGILAWLLKKVETPIMKRLS